MKYCSNQNKIISFSNRCAVSVLVVISARVVAIICIIDPPGLHSQQRGNSRTWHASAIGMHAYIFISVYYFIYILQGM